MGTRRLLVALLLGLMVGSWAYAQSIAIKPVTPTILSGNDFGFRVEGTRGDTTVGTLVVKVNGQWVAADPSGATRSLSLNNPKP